MITARKIGQSTFAAFLGVAVVLWSVVPATSHAPTIFETLQEHAEMIAEHGHSHGLEEDLYWALHGHSHDSADHDHSQAMLALVGASQPFPDIRDAWRLRLSPAGASRVFRSERPPRL